MSLFGTIGGALGGVVGSLVGAPTVGAALGSALLGGGTSGTPGPHMWNVTSASQFIQLLYDHAESGETYYRAWLADIADDGTGPSSQIGDKLHKFTSGEQQQAKTLLAQFDMAHPVGSYTVPPAPYTYPPTEPTGQPIAATGFQQLASALQRAEQSAQAGAVAEVSGVVAGAAGQTAVQQKSVAQQTSVFGGFTPTTLVVGGLALLIIILLAVAAAHRPKS